MAIHETTLTCLIWGGRSISLVTLRFKDTSIPYAQFSSLVQEILLDDWIFDACFLPYKVLLSNLEQALLHAIVVTDHNQLTSLCLSRTHGPGGFIKPIISTLSTGPPSILYSAHVVWSGSGNVIVAAGTAFGDVLVWSCHIDNLETPLVRAVPATLLGSFSGHEGSIFGVDIVSIDLQQDIQPSQLVVASCSDDRTIRLWSINHESGGQHQYLASGGSFHPRQTGFGGEMPHRSLSGGGCIAHVMSHLSRIWNIKFPALSKFPSSLLSFGEDATTRLWRLEQRVTNNMTELETRVPILQYDLYEEDVLKFHVGKNIWASDVHQCRDGTRLLTTGGADGRVIVNPLANYRQARRCKIELEDCMLKKSTEAFTDDRQATTKRLFSELRGAWTIHRKVKSLLSSLPSGDFEGSAQFIPRPPSDPSYDAELLYAEEGHFRTENGLNFEARRRYVYRHQSSSGSISSWFVKADETTVDYLFHELTFSGLLDLKPSDSVIDAIGSHLCIDDNYAAEYKFKFRKRSLSSWSLSYHVTGPMKDYTADATYIRAQGVADVLVPYEERFVDHNKIRGPSLEHFAQDSYKAYCWISKSTILITTAAGRVLLAELQTAQSRSRAVVSTSIEAENIVWDNVGQFNELQAHSILCSIPGCLAVIGGREGMLFVYFVCENIILPLFQLPRKIAFLSVHQGKSKGFTVGGFVVIVTCLGMTGAYRILFTPDMLIKQHTELIPTRYVLHLPDDFIVTSSNLISDEFLVLGSRHGSICLYDQTKHYPEEVNSPLIHVSHVHGNDTVTHIERLPVGDHFTQEIYFITTGRDSRFATLRFLEQESGLFLVETVHNSELPLGPNIEGASIDPITLDFLSWGFRGKEFVVWNNTRQQEVMTIECGGGNRTWSYLPHQDGKDGGSFAWTKASSLYTILQTEASHRIAETGCHGREIKAITIRQKNCEGGEVIIATGAEDATIRISRYHNSNNGEPQTFQCLTVIYKHVTGPQVLRWSSDGRYLFSAGGQEEFYIWLVQRVPCIGIGALFIAQCPHVTESRDLRITDFDITNYSQVDDANNHQYLISIAYSDSTVRVSSSTHIIFVVVQTKSF